MTKSANQQYQFWVKLAAIASTTVAILLVLIKLYAWLVSDATAMLASATDSLLDVLVSVINLLILRFALSPPDDDHKFGHGKAESLAGIAQAAFIAGSAMLLIFHGIERIYSPKVIEHSTIAIVVTLIALVLTVLLVALQHVVVSKTKSVIIEADSLHYRSDILLNVGVLASLLLTNQLWLEADGVFTVLVGCNLLFGTFKILKNSFNQLMDRELQASDIERIHEIVKQHENVLGFHQLKTRQAGAIKFVQLHLELDDQLRLVDAHAIADKVERNIATELAPCEVIIHQDPTSVVPEKS